MTIYYVDSAAGSNTAPYDTWAKAAILLETIAAIDAAGDTIYVAHTHAETSAFSPALSWAGTIASPTTIICADKTSGAPPATLATSATITTTGNSSLTPATNTGQASVYFYGISFIAGSGASGTANINLTSTGGLVIYESCSFQVATTSATSSVAVTGVVKFKSCTVKFANAGQVIGLNNTAALFVAGGSLLSGGTSPTALLKTNSAGGFARVEAFDLSNASAGINLVSNAAATGALIGFHNCKLPSSWSGALCSAAPGSGWQFQTNNVDATGTNSRIIMMSAYGTLTNESTLIRPSGANDGANGLSWKVVTTADAKYQSPFITGEFVIWNDATGSSKTITVEILHDNATALKDNEVWVEAEYLGSSAAPLGTTLNDSSSMLGVGTNQSSSSATWTTTGMSNPNTQKLEVTFTPQTKGFIHVRVHVAKASYTLYVDPFISVQ